MKAILMIFIAILTVDVYAQDIKTASTEIIQGKNIYVNIQNIDTSETKSVHFYLNKISKRIEVSSSELVINEAINDTGSFIGSFDFKNKNNIVTSQKTISVKVLSKSKFNLWSMLITLLATLLGSFLTFGISRIQESRIQKKEIQRNLLFVKDQLYQSLVTTEKLINGHPIEIPNWLCETDSSKLSVLKLYTDLGRMHDELLKDIFEYNRKPLTKKNEIKEKLKNLISSFHTATAIQ